MEKKKKRISGIEIGSRFRKELGDIDALAKSICDIGLLHPIVVAPDGQLIAGERRLRACQSLGWKTIPVTIVTPSDPQRMEADENIVRLQLQPSEAVEVKRYFEAAEKEAADKRKQEGRKKGASKGGKTAGRGRKKKSNSLGTNFVPRQRDLASDRVAKRAGISRETLKKAEEVIEAAEEDPETFGPIAEEMDATGKVDPAHKKVRRLKGEKPKKKRKRRSDARKIPDPEELAYQAAQRSFLTLALKTRKRFLVWAEKHVND